MPWQQYPGKQADAACSRPLMVRSSAPGQATTKVAGSFVSEIRLPESPVIRIAMTTGSTEDVFE